MLRAYFDDSGTHDGSPVVVWGGLIGTEEQWTEFDRKWRHLLAKPLPDKAALTKFSLWDCTRGEGDFAGYNQAERDLVTRLFRQVIIESELVSTAAIIPPHDWDDLVTGEMREQKGDAEQQCVVHCLVRTIGIAEDYYKGDQIAVMFDKGRESLRLHQMIHSVLDWHDGIKSAVRIADIDFGIVRECTPLQGADTVATESYWYGKEFLSAGNDAARASARAHFLAFEKDMRCEGMILSREAIEENVRQFEFEQFQRSFLA